MTSVRTLFSRLAISVLALRALLSRTREPTSLVLFRPLVSLFYSLVDRHTEVMVALLMLEPFYGRFLRTWIEIFNWTFFRNLGWAASDLSIRSSLTQCLARTVFVRSMIIWGLLLLVRNWR